RISFWWNMLILTYVLFIVFSACFARHTSDVAEEFKKHIDTIDSKFYSTFRRLLSQAPVKGLDAVGSFFGYLSGISIAAYFIGLFIGSPEPAWTIFLLGMFFYTLAGWFGIKWFTKASTFSL